MNKAALIIGGGIAGPVAASALRTAGWDAAVYEAQEHGADGAGAFLTLAVNGMAALEAIGLRERVDHLGMSTPAMLIHSGRGKHLATIPMQARTVRRSEVYRALRDEAVRRGVRVEFGKRLVAAESTPDGVLARFADGTTAEGAVLVGADGLGSRTRRLIDPAAPRARHVGLLNTGGYARGVTVPGEPGVAHFVFGRRCFFGYFVHPNGEVWWFANPPSRREPSREELRAVTSEQWRRRLIHLFAGDVGPMLDIIAATDEIIPAWNTYDLGSVPTWHDDRKVIIGDAAHAMSPSAGQGASMAIEDGVLLARCLRDADDPGSAFATYTGLRRSRVERVVKQGRRNGTGKAPGPMGAWVRDLAMPLVMRRASSKGSQDWILDYRIDWSHSMAATSRS